MAFIRVQISTVVSSQLRTTIVKYLHDTLNIVVGIKLWEKGEHLPYFLQDNYRKVIKQSGGYLLRANNPDYEDCKVTENMGQFARLIEVLPKESVCFD